MMQECMPPMPGGSVNVTVSIDLGSLLGGNQCPPPPSPSTSLTCMPVDPKPECDPEKITRFSEAKENVAGKFGKPDKKNRSSEGEPSWAGDEDKYEKEDKER